MDCKDSLAVSGIENSLAGRVWQVEPTGFAHPRVVVFKTRHDALDTLANVVVITRQRFPIDRGPIFERCSCQSSDDLRFAQKLWRSGRERSMRHLHHAHRILSGDKLWSSGLRVNFGATKTRQNQRALAGD